MNDANRAAADTATRHSQVGAALALLEQIS